MSWTKLLAENRVSLEPSSKQEMDSLRSIVARCSSDMNVVGISDEQRFIIAYDAARTLALMVVRASGYRPRKQGGHFNTFKGLAAADAIFTKAAGYFDLCRMKRNDSEYDSAGGISQSDCEDLVKEVKLFQTIVEKWIALNHPGFV